MTVQALEQFSGEGGFKFKKITPMALEGDGTIRKKVSRLVLSSSSMYDNNGMLRIYCWLDDFQGLQPPAGE